MVFLCLICSFLFCFLIELFCYLCPYYFHVVHSVVFILKSVIFFFQKILFIFRERGREGEIWGEKHQGMVASHVFPYSGPGLQPRHVPWLGIEPMTLGSQAGAQSTEPHQPGLNSVFKPIKRQEVFYNYSTSDIPSVPSSLANLKELTYYSYGAQLLVIKVILFIWKCLLSLTFTSTSKVIFGEHF